jgi:hypothetical protein
MSVGVSETFILYKINGIKRLQNHVHGTFTFTLQNLKNYFIKKIIFFIVRKVSDVSFLDQS